MIYFLFTMIKMPSARLLNRVVYLHVDFNKRFTWTILARAIHSFGCLLPLFSKFKIQIPSTLCVNVLSMCFVCMYIYISLFIALFHGFKLYISKKLEDSIQNSNIDANFGTYAKLLISITISFLIILCTTITVKLLTLGANIRKIQNMTIFFLIV